MGYLRRCVVAPLVENCILNHLYSLRENAISVGRQPKPTYPSTVAGSKGIRRTQSRASRRNDKGNMNLL